ncbi:MAG: TonB-dependent receptor [Lewinellaceae bacterium]|nr:TonB-dependent receptor [Lewinellaceae bacterium]
MRSSIIALLLLIAAIVQLPAQTSASITGKVTDETGAPVAYANALLLYAQDSTLAKGALTDSSGIFTFENAPGGRYLVSISYVGYATAYTSLFETGAGQAPVQLAPISLSQEGIALEEIVVKASRPFIQLDADKMTINVENSPVAAGNTALEVLARAPGVTVDQNNTINLKGKQGVQILINGKNTHLSAEDVARMLENMPAESIQKIEIIHSPSARYEASGNAGVINIQIKKDRKLGLNGSANLQAGQGTYPKAGGGLRLNYRQRGWNAFGDYSYRRNESFQQINLFRSIQGDLGTTTFDQGNRQVNLDNSHWASGGIDWTASERTTAGIFFRTQTGSKGQQAFNRTLLGGTNPNPFILVDADRFGDEHWGNYSFNFNLAHQFARPGQSLSFDADYSSFKNEDLQDYRNFFLDENGQQAAAPNLLSSDNRSMVEIKALKADYSQPLGETARLEAGAKASTVTTDNNIEFRQHQDGNWLVDSSRTNQFLYEENIYAAYLNASKQFGGFNLQLGLRAEYTQSDGYSVTLAQKTKRDYLDLFPSASLSHQIGENHSLSYAFSRRIDRPSYQNLNPFIYFLDQYTFLKGNPFLQPQYSNTVSVNYGYKQRYFLTLAYTHTSRFMSEILDQDDEQLLTFQTMANLDRFDNYSLNLHVPVTITDWWSARFNLSAYYNGFQSVYLGQAFDNSQFSYNINMNQNFNLPEGFKAEISGYYQSGMAYSFFDISHRYQIDLGVSKTFLDGRADLRLSIADLFNLREHKVDIVQGNINVQVDNKWETRRATLSFTYRFGNEEVKPARRRTTATEEEQDRAKGN